MPKLEVSYQKALKLTNVLMIDVPIESLGNYPVVVEQMENYIKTKGFQPIGPLVQYNAIAGQGEDATVLIRLMRQCSGYINHVEKPYAIESVLRVPHCVYVRFSGDSDKMQMGYNKLTLTAYEEDIPLRGDSYTVFVSGDDEIVTADIFMPRTDLD